mmetsp:Transcript_6112/g.6275  ORF Transcript_6112/g.6275 Transcript_6112/m.6275 type:complete len:80 (-) Transcript_6112:324-563(-)
MTSFCGYAGTGDWLGGKGDSLRIGDFVVLPEVTTTGDLRLLLLREAITVGVLTLLFLALLLSVDVTDKEEVKGLCTSDD